MKLEPLWMEQTAGQEEYQAGKELDEGGKLRLEEQTPRLIRYTVAGIPPRSVSISGDLNAACDCDVFKGRGNCRHVVAAWLSSEKEGIPERFLRSGASQRGQDLMTMMERDFPAEQNVRLEVTLAVPQYAEMPLRLGFRIGQKKLYVVRDLRTLLKAMQNETELDFGRGFRYEPAWMRFNEEDEACFRLLRKMMSRLIPAEGTDEGEGRSAQRMIALPEAFLEDWMNLLCGRNFRLMLPDGSMHTCEKIETVFLPLRIQVGAGPRGIQMNAQIPASFRPLDSSCTWGLLDGRLVKVEREQQSLAGLLWKKQYDGRCLFTWAPQETERVIGEVLPYLKLRGAVDIQPELQRRLVQRNLKAEVYLDRDGKSILGKVQFLYGGSMINPFAPVTEKIVLEKGEKLLLRDAEAEHVVLDILAGAGFRVGRENIRLSGTDEVFDFVSEGVHRLQEVCDVYLSREFRRILPRRPSLRGGLRMQGDQLELMLEVDGEPTDEVLELLEALNSRRRYFRLKNGEFLDLTELSNWQEAAAGIYEAAVRDANDLGRDRLLLRSYRASYLTSMLAQSDIPIEADEEVRRISDTLSGDIQRITPSLSAAMSLRDYQQRGFEWMMSLDHMHMGGVLADEMGLGKTAQVIALLAAVRKAGQTSLVVAPTSLTYNWLSEIRRFAPQLSAAVCSGNGEQRERLIRHVLTCGDVDVLITSYPLIRRDIGHMKDYHFRTVILDEAQNIKNAGSMAASAVKELQADSRFALTGSPMENGIGELWSIFDFVLPGYLPGYNTFLRQYQDGANAEDLLRRIRPFLTRRMKQEVLEELPDKTETLLTARMTPEQEQVYRAALERWRPRVTQMLENGTLSRSRMEVLSALTEMRQICCHPSLVMDGYRGTSGKEELLTEILPGIIRGGGRVLLFSQFTRMLRLLETHLREMGFSTLYLDGETPAGERLELTERFNAGEGEIFLISLRAGGSGLNLTGADTVIHYDPWWNPATEDQATDRAHRIGQTRKVQVLRLVTHGTIEEQVVELGERKKALFDRLIRPGESALSALSEQDIRALFT